MSELQTLLQSRQEIDARIAAIQREKRAEHVAAVHKYMAEHGLTLADLGAVERSRAAKAASAGKKLPAKYRDETGNTWSGRGFQPVWLRNRLAAGARLEQFLIG